MSTPTFKQLLANPNHLFAFGFGSGLAKKAPGTFGTLAAIPFFFAVAELILAAVPELVSSDLCAGCALV